MVNLNTPLMQGTYEGQEGRKSHQGVRGVRLGVSGEAELWKLFRLTKEQVTYLHPKEHSGQPGTGHWGFLLSVCSERHAMALGQSTLVP